VHRKEWGEGNAFLIEAKHKSFSKKHLILTWILGGDTMTQTEWENEMCIKILELIQNELYVDFVILMLPFPHLP
jgi:hypothetical protein